MIKSNFDLEEKKFENSNFFYSFLCFKRLLNPTQCQFGPRYNSKCSYCDNQTVSNFGMTLFSKIRLDIKTLTVIRKNFILKTKKTFQFQI
jgi:hypothetical protein